MIVGCIAAATLASVLAAEPDQAIATLQGSVRDQQGGAIVNAAIVVVCGSECRRVASGERGDFEVSGLPLSTCSVTAESRGFAPRTVTVTLSPSSTRVNLILAVPVFATDVVVTPARLEEQAIRVPESVSVTSRNEIDSRPFTLLPQVLREEAGILLQQTTTAQVSPIIRGFTGQSNVYLLDGVRFNTASWRTGPSQYLGWIDGAMVDRLEIVRGPGSVQYGSDALGGTINVLTYVPSFSLKGARAGGDVQLGFGSADRSANGQAAISIVGPRAAFRIGGSTMRVEDLRPGRGIDSHAAVTRFLGLPSSVIGEQLPNTGFNQSGAYIVGRVRAGALADVGTVVLHETQSGASRYDRIQGGDGLYRSGFDPQTLDFARIKYQRQQTGGFDNVSVGFSVNQQRDGRYEQTRPIAVLDRQRATTRALGLQLEGHRHIGGRNRATVGAEFYDEAIAATRAQVNPQTGVAVRNRPDIPDGTKYSNFGAFVEDVADVVPGRVSVRGGFRYGRFGFRTAADPELGVADERVTSNAVTFNAGTVVALTSRVSATFSAGRGFRAANAADLGSIGLTGGGGFEITPSGAASLGGFVGTTGATGASSTGVLVPRLRPEVLYSFEPGLRFHSRRFNVSLAVYDAEYLDAIERRAIVFDTNVVGTTISGFQVVRQDSTGLAYIAQDIRPIATRVNAGRARIRGFEVDGTVQLTDRWTARAFGSRIDGHLLATGEYLRRMPPPLGGAAVRWTGDRVWVEATTSFAAAQTRLNSGDLTDARIGGTRTRTSIANYFNGTAVDLGLVRGGVLVATGETLAQVQTRVLGTAGSAPLFDRAPGFAAVGFRAGLRVSSQFDVTVIGENLTDRNYRLYGSGVDAPGINVQIRTRYRF